MRLFCSLALAAAALVGWSACGGSAVAAADAQAPSAADAAPTLDASAAPDVAAPAPDAAEPADGSSPDGGLRPDSGASCDPIAQDCAAAKCAVVLDTASDSWQPLCLPAAEARAEGESCTRDLALGPGYDDCAAGAFCSFYGVLPPALGGERRCRRYCLASADCASASGDRCVDFGSGLTPNIGLCVPSCTLFGNDCPAPLDCSEIDREVSGALFAYCRPVGTGARGSLCDPADTERDHCGPGLICLDEERDGLGSCTPLCDATHPCPFGPCHALAEAPNGAGICDP